jgi:hypothetical protein
MNARLIEKRPAALGRVGAMAMILLTSGCVQTPDSDDPLMPPVDMAPDDLLVGSTTSRAPGSVALEPRLGWQAEDDVSSSDVAPAATLSCPSSTTLESLIDCISGQMPQHDSDGFVAPTSTQKADFQTVVQRMLGQECDFPLPTSLSANMAIRTFTDSSNGRSYCLLMEVTSTVTPGVVDKGWGTFITYPDATREISHHAPHPKFDTSSPGSSGDSYTEREAVRIFKLSDSRSYLMAGARRSANLSDSSCQPSYEESDCSHNVDNMFFPANQALDAFYGASDWTAIEWHAKAASTCPNDIFMSIGFNANPPAGSKVLILKSQIAIQRPTWIVQTPRKSSCSLNATTNVSGRFLNDVPLTDVCDTNASTPSHKFLHIEQTVNIIGADLDGVATSWANAIIAAFPATP